MKNLCAAISVLVFAASGSAQCVRDEVVISNLRGTVVDSQAKEPVADVLVSVRKGRYGYGKPLDEVRTDDSGNFDLSRLKKGRYELTVSYPNFDRIFTRLEITKRKNRNDYLSSYYRAIRSFGNRLVRTGY